MTFIEGQPASLNLPLEVHSAISPSNLKCAYLKSLITEIIMFNLPVVQPLPFQKHNEQYRLFCVNQIYILCA